MKIAVLGAGGFIGRGLYARLAGEGHDTVALPRDPSDWAEALSACDAVVNLAGENIAGGRWTEERKRLLYDSRVLTTRALVDASVRAWKKPSTLINASAVGYYGNRGGEVLTEDSAAGSDFLARLCADWEAAANAASRHGIRTVCLRLGVVLGPDGGALAKMTPAFKLFVGGPLGNGTQWMSWIHRDDAVSLIMRLITQGDIAGPVNACAPAPATNEEFSATLAGVLGRPCWARVPAKALEIAVGEMSEVLLGSQRAMPNRALMAAFSFRYPGLRAALEACFTSQQNRNNPRVS